MSDATTPLRDAFVAMHEAFMEAQAAGFTEDQALTIVVGMATRGTQQ